MINDQAQNTKSYQEFCARRTEGLERVRGEDKQHSRLRQRVFYRKMDSRQLPEARSKKMGLAAIQGQRMMPQAL